MRYHYLRVCTLFIIFSYLKEHYISYLLLVLTGLLVSFSYYYHIAFYNYYYTWAYFTDSHYYILLFSATANVIQQQPCHLLAIIHGFMQSSLQPLFSRKEGAWASSDFVRLLFIFTPWFILPPLLAYISKLPYHTSTHKIFSKPYQRFEITKVIIISQHITAAAYSSLRCVRAPQRLLPPPQYCKY